MLFTLLESSPSTSLSTLGDVFTQIITWLISLVSMISTEPLLLVGLAIVVAGAIFGLAFRVIRGKGRGRG